MTPSMTKPETRRLMDRTAARHILDTACQSRVSMGIRPDNPTSGSQTTGTVARMDADAETLVVALDAPLHPASPGDWFLFSFRIANRAFAFRTRWVGMDRPGQAGAAVFTYPTAIEAVDRRRAPRRRFRNRSIVSLAFLEPASSSAVRGSLLNLSASGLAFLLDAPPPPALVVGATIRVTLEGDATADPLLLPARLVSITQGADPCTWVVGIEFLRDDLSSKVGVRLAQWLKSPDEQ